MTVATMETNLDGVQEAEKAMQLVDKGQKKKKLHRMSHEMFDTVFFVSCGINFINMFILLCMFILVDIQLHGWKRSFKNDWNSDIQMQYNQMQLSAILYSSIFLSMFSTEFIYFAGLDNLIKAWRKMSWMSFLSILFIGTCFSFILTFYVSPSKAAESFAQNIVEVEYSLPKTPNSLLYLKCLCILSSIQNIFLITIIVLLKPKDFDINFVNDQYPSNAITKQEEEEVDNISKTYVVC